MTVRTRQSRAAPPQEPGPAPEAAQMGGMAVVAVYRGREGMDGASLRASVATVVLEAAALARGGKVMADGPVIVALLPPVEGDAERAWSGAFRKVYLDGCRSHDAEVAKAREVVALAEASGCADAIGLGIVRRYLTEMSMLGTAACIHMTGGRE